MKYVKKPIPVEAIQIPVVDVPMPDWLIEAIQKGFITFYSRRRGWCVKTLEGDMYAPFGSYIIKDVDGELYPCREDIFEKSYEVYEE